MALEDGLDTLNDQDTKDSYNSSKLSLLRKTPSKLKSSTILCSTKGTQSLNPELEFLYNVENLKVNAVKIINNKIYALIIYEYKMGDQKIIKQDLIQTAHLANSHAQKLIQYYESKLEFVKPDIPISEESDDI